MTHPTTIDDTYNALADLKTNTDDPYLAGVLAACEDLLDNAYNTADTRNA